MKRLVLELNILLLVTLVWVRVDEAPADPSGYLLYSLLAGTALTNFIALRGMPGKAKAEGEPILSGG